jgi:RNA polymerase sigma-70 factor (ECF subfamily)
MQEILLALWRSLESFRGDASLRTWMYRVAHNVAATHIHRAKRKPAIEPRMTESASTDGALDASLDDARRIDRLRDAIQTLGPLDRQLILLHLEKIPHSEIAQVTGLTATNVGTRIGRIRETLAQLMNTKRTP